MRQQSGVSLVSLLLIVATLIAGAVWWKREQSAKQKAVALAEYTLQAEQRRASERKVAEEARLAEEKAEADNRHQADQLRAETEKAFLALADATAKFNDGVKLAKSTARIALSSPVAALQKIMRETETLAVPTCFAAPQRKLVEGMAKYIDAFLLFMSDPKLGEFKAILKMDDGARLIADVESELDTCKRAVNQG